MLNNPAVALQEIAVSAMHVSASCLFRRKCNIHANIWTSNACMDYSVGIPAQNSFKYCMSDKSHILQQAEIY